MQQHNMSQLAKMEKHWLKKPSTRISKGISWFQQDYQSDRNIHEAYFNNCWCLAYYFALGMGTPWFV
jgi:hypothetical protein